MKVHQKGADDSRAEKNKTNWMRDICFFLSYCGHLSGTVHKIKKSSDQALRTRLLCLREKRHPFPATSPSSTTSLATCPLQRPPVPHDAPLSLIKCQAPTTSHLTNQTVRLNPPPPQQVRPEPHTCKRGGGGGVPELLESTKPHSLETESSYHWTVSPNYPVQGCICMSLVAGAAAARLLISCRMQKKPKRRYGV